MRLPTQKKIMREDLKGAPSWVGKLIDVLNPFMETVYQAMNKNITLSDNVACFIREFNYTTDASYPAAQPTFTFNNDLKTRPIGLMCLQVYDKTTYEPAAGPVYLPWTEANGTISISTITGLQASKSYVVRVLVV